MKRVLFLTNYASPYRVHFYDELAKSMDVTVLFTDRVEDQKNRSADWFVPGGGAYRPVQLKRCVAHFLDENLCLDVTEWLKKPYDAIVICGYSSPTAILAMRWLRRRKIPFYMEVDGGLIRQERKIKYLFKKVAGAQGGPVAQLGAVHHGISRPLRSGGKPHSFLSLLIRV